MNISDQLKEAIHDTNQTTYSLAKQTGVADAVLSRFLSNKRDIKLSTAARLCTVLGLELKRENMDKMDNIELIQDIHIKVYKKDNILHYETNEKTIVIRDRNDIQVLIAPEAEDVIIENDKELISIIAPKATYVSCKSSKKLTSLDLPEATTLCCQGCNLFYEVNLPKLQTVYCSSEHEAQMERLTKVDKVIVV